MMVLVEILPIIWIRATFPFHRSLPQFSSSGKAVGEEKGNTPNFSKPKTDKQFHRMFFHEIVILFTYVNVFFFHENTIN